MNPIIEHKLEQVIDASNEVIDLCQELRVFLDEQVQELDKLNTERIRQFGEV